MHPAFSVIFLTTLIGVGQGLFLGLYAAEVSALLGVLAQAPGREFFVGGSAISAVFLGAGLFASFFHLGRPERAWRAVAMWRTSWLSREVIVLPAFIALVALYGAAHFLGLGETPLIGAFATLACIALFLCTGMIYACIRFLQEWATPLTVINFTLLGCASGLTLAAAFAAATQSALGDEYATGALAFTVAAFLSRVASLVRNRRLRPKSSLQTALGIKHPRIVQKSQGFTGGSFNTREFFHGRTPALLRSVRWFFLVCAFALPALLLAMGLTRGTALFFPAAFVVQYLGLVAERWFFFAQANHPQNLYYQAVS